MEVAYKRVLLKLSGEALAGEKKTGVDVEVLGKICDKVKEIVDMGVTIILYSFGIKASLISWVVTFPDPSESQNLKASIKSSGVSSFFVNWIHKSW